MCLSELPLKRQDWECLNGFADCNGYMDSSLQMQMIELKLQDLKKVATEIEEEMTRQGRLTVILGFMGGIFLTLILL